MTQNTFPMAQRDIPQAGGVVVVFFFPLRGACVMVNRFDAVIRDRSFIMLTASNEKRVPRFQYPIPSNNSFRQKINSSQIEIQAISATEPPPPIIIH
jgi:hypothetical protein